MASNASTSDPLILFRQSIAAGKLPIPTSTSDATTSADTQLDLKLATHLQVNYDGHTSFPLETPTRFVSASSSQAVNLRTVYYVWQNRHLAIADYVASVQAFSEQLKATGDKTIQNLNTVEKLDLTAWLEGASDESDFITPLAATETAAQATGAAGIAAGTLGGIATVPSGSLQPRGKKTVDPRLQEIYNGERRMGDRNSVLRGIKPTDFSHVRKLTEVFLGRNRAAQRPAANAGPGASNTALVSNLKKPGRRPEPIILLSPSASSLLRMSNIKQFLDTGVFVPADSASAGSSNTANILHISRTLPSIDPARPQRFVLVDSPEQFKPDYWQRVVAVFTTGQTWQFKSYKWTSPTELFTHALGIYVGWLGEDVPPPVKGWGRSVRAAALDKWNPHQTATARWRDREVVEGIWNAIEDSMKHRGWSKEGLPSAR